MFLAAIDLTDQPSELGIDERLSSADRHNRSAALFHCMKALFNREFFPNRFRIFANSTASCARQVTSVQGLEHHDERKFVNTPNAFARDVGGHSGSHAKGKSHFIL